jgi:hypothetical protein
VEAAPGRQAEGARDFPGEAMSAGDAFDVFLSYHWLARALAHPF